MIGLDEYQESGFEVVSMIEVAQAIGLSKPGLYHHWPSNRRSSRRSSACRANCSCASSRMCGKRASIPVSGCGSLRLSQPATVRAQEDGHMIQYLVILKRVAFNRPRIRQH